MHTGEGSKELSVVLDIPTYSRASSLVDVSVAGKRRSGHLTQVRRTDVSEQHRVKSKPPRQIGSTSSQASRQCSARTAFVFRRHSET